MSLFLGGLMRFDSWKLRKTSQFDISFLGNVHQRSEQAVGGLWAGGSRWLSGAGWHNQTIFSLSQADLSGTPPTPVKYAEWQQTIQLCISIAVIFPCSAKGD